MGKFNFTEPEAKQPVRIESVFAEKPAGGVIVCEDKVLATTAVSAPDADGVHKPIKAYRVVEATESSATSVKIAKECHVTKGEFVATGKKSVEVTAVDSSNEAYDVATIASLGVALKAGDVLYQAGSASTSASPIYTPAFVTGNDREPDVTGYASVRLINGGNLRKETANIAPEVAALLSGIALV